MTTTRTATKADNKQQTAEPAQPIARLAPSRLPIVGSIAKEFEITANEWRVLVDQIFPNAKTVEAIGMAVSYCRARKLDIFKRPVHIVPMWSSVLGRMVETVWPGISEIRTTAHRTGEYAGIDAVQFGDDIDAEFEGVTGRDRIAKSVRFPEWASVTVYRWVKGQKAAFNALVYWEEIYATIGKTDVPNDMWAKRPRGQLMKCVEAAALRMAFPEELGNVYAAEEMEGRTIDGNVNVATAIPAEQEKPLQQLADIPDVPDLPEGDDKEGQEKAAPIATALDVDAYLARLDEELVVAETIEIVEEIFDSLDVQPNLADNEQAIERAFEIRKKHINRITNTKADDGEADMFPGDKP